MSDGWIGVDFDGTLAIDDGYVGPNHVGGPVWPMIHRVKGWLNAGTEVRIVTARVGCSGKDNGMGDKDDEAFVKKQRALLERWCVQYLGVALRITASKDFDMIELWDDRAIQVERNTGVVIGLKQSAESQCGQ